MSKCDICICNSVCDHNRFGWENCGNFKDKSLFVELPCEWGGDVYTVVKPCHILQTKLFAVGIDEDGYTVYNPTEYPKVVFGIKGVFLGENTFSTKEEAEQKLKELEK